MHYYLLIFSFVVAICSKAQIPLDEKAYADSIIRRTQSSLMEERAGAHYALSGFYFAKSDSLNMAKQLAIAKELTGSSQFLKDVALFYQANLYYDTDREKAIVMYKKADSALKKYRKPEAFFLRSKAWGNIANLMQLNDDENAFIEMLTTKAMPLARQAGNPSRIGSIYLDIGIGLSNNIHYQKSNEYLYKAIDAVKDLKPVFKILPDAWLLIAKNHIMTEQYDSVPWALSKAHSVLKNFPSSDMMAEYYQINGMYLYKVKDFSNSLKSLDKGIDIAKKHNNQYLAQGIYNRKFNLYFEQGQFEHALNVLNESSKMQGLMAFIRNRMGMVYNYSRVYGAIGNYRNAYDSLSKFIDIFDSLTTADFYEKTRLLETKFNVAEKEKKIAVLEVEKREAQLRQKNSKLTNWLLWAGCIILFISFLSLYFYYRNRKKLSMQKEINYRQHLIELEQKQQLASAEAMLEGEERERRRMARDLHDGLGGLLAGIKIKLSGHAKTENNTKQDLNKVIEQLDYSVSELRRISRNMMPESLVRFGLETSLRDLCESLTCAQTRIRFEAIGVSNDIELSTQIVIYRIIQEALSNALRHADAKNILLQCSQNGAVFFITIEDDGKGFDKAELQNKKGIGLGNIENRVKYLKGKLDIASQPDEGTIINVELNVAA